MLTWISLTLFPTVLLALLAAFPQSEQWRTKMFLFRVLSIGIGTICIGVTSYIDANNTSDNMRQISDNLVKLQTQTATQGSLDANFNQQAVNVERFARTLDTNVASMESRFLHYHNSVTVPFEQTQMPEWDALLLKTAIGLQKFDNDMNQAAEKIKFTFQEAPTLKADLEKFIADVKATPSKNAVQLKQRMESLAFMLSFFRLHISEITGEYRFRKSAIVTAEYAKLLQSLQGTLPPIQAPNQPAAK